MKTVRFLPVAALLAMIACVASARAAKLYDADTYYFDPTTLASAQNAYTFTVKEGNSKANDIKAVGYYIIDRDAVSAGTIPDATMLKDFSADPIVFDANQVMGIWARRGGEDSNNYHYSTVPEKNGKKTWFALGTGDGFVLNVTQDQGNDKIEWIVSGTTFTGEIVPVDDGGSSSQTTGAPLPAALATLLLMGGVGGSLSLRKRRQA